MRRRFHASAVVVAAVVGSAVIAGGPTTATAAGPDPWTVGTYESLAPATRFFDSRYSALGRALRPRETVDVKVDGRLGVPSHGVAAVVANLTVTGPTAAGNLAAVPKGAAATSTSSLNFVAGDTRASLATVPVSADGWISVRNNSSGTAHVVVDVQGFYLDGYPTGEGSISGCDFTPVSALRVVDTRSSTPLSSGDSPGTYGDGRIFPLRLPERLRSVNAFAVTVTVVRPTGRGYLTLSNDMARPTPTLNYRSGETTTNAAVVMSAGVRSDYDAPVLMADLTGYGTADLVVDLNGVYDCVEPGLVYRNVAKATRIVDTRSRLGTSPLGSGTTATVRVPSTVASSATTVLVGTTTAVRSTQSTYLSLWQHGTAKPAGSNLNPAAGQTVAGMTYLPLDAQKRFDVYNNLGTTDLLVDVTGRFELHPPRR